MTWDYFIYYALLATGLWTAGAWLAWRRRNIAAVALTVGGLIAFLFFIVQLWASLERPPLRTMGETRLWYSLFLPLAGLIVYLRWNYRWILSFSTLLSVVFICVNLLKPEIHSKALMPALQSPWFAPHVIVYMFAYAVFGAATIVAIVTIVKGERQKTTRNAIEACDNLVYVGYCFLTVGMLFGALWAKEAWGHYWSWDPKETWAAITWMAYLIYIHAREARPRAVRPMLWLLIACFLLLQMCWWGINYLPSAQGASVHTYGM